MLARRVSQVILEIKEDEASETHPHPTQHSWDQLHKAFNISAGHSALASWHTLNNILAWAENAFPGFYSLLLESFYSLLHLLIHLGYLLHFISLSS